jgi:ABC-type phosphate/phosphonate transport system ATPase subunit
MAAGRVVFDGAPEQLTELEAQRLYGLESETRSHSPARSGFPAEESVLGIAAVA